MSIIHLPSEGDQQTLLMVTGGVDRSYQAPNDAGLLGIGDGASWREVSALRSTNCDC